MSKQKPSSHTPAKLSATPPPPKTLRTPTYSLDHYNLRRHVKVVSIQLHGIRGSEKRTESITLPLLPYVTDAEYIRAAAYFSPNKWSVPLSMNVKQFDGRFDAALNEALLAALMPSSQAPSIRSQNQSVLYNAPTVANTSFSQAQFPPSVPQPGQFQQAYPYQAPMQGPRRGRNLWGWYKARTTKTKIGLGCGALIALLIFFSCIGAAFSSTTLVPTPTSTPTSQVVQSNQHVTDTPTQALPTPTSTVLPSPTVKPEATTTAKPTVQPTSRPTQPPATPTPCPGVNCNPWGYNFTPGNYITNPPSTFCAYFNCIASFWNGNGYVVECQDAMYSLSGGVQGACSHHGGVWRPLYSH